MRDQNSKTNTNNNLKQESDEKKQQVKGEYKDLQQYASKTNHADTIIENDDELKHQHTKTHEHEEMKHDNHMSHDNKLRQKFFISLTLAIPIMLLSPVMGVKLPFQHIPENAPFIVVILATILFSYGGSFFIKGAIEEFKQKSPGMMALITLGISVAYFYSLYAFVHNLIYPKEHLMDFFWELATLIVIMLLGHYIEMKAIASAGNAVDSIAQLLPNKANLVTPDGIKTVDLKDIKAGDVLEVNPNDRIPTDGIIIEGRASIDESMLTGESQLVNKTLKDSVIGGSINSNNLIKIKATKIGEETYLNQVMRLVHAAQKDKSRIENLSDKVAKVLFYVAIIVSIIAFLVWFNNTKNLTIALERMVTVLIIACPHALGLAIPLVIARFTSIGAHNGLIIKNRQIIEKADNISDVFMDKTGTLTQGKFEVQEVIAFQPRWDKNNILQYSASLESASSHPLAVSIINKAKEFNLALLEVKHTKELPGIGIQGQIKRKNYIITNMQYLDNKKITYPQEKVTNLLNCGYTLSFLVSNNGCLGVIAQGDRVRKESYEAIDELYNMRMNPIMLTGDNLQAGYKVAEELGIVELYTELLPEDKEEIIKSHQKKGDVVAMVGDGINDAISLARANVGIAIGAGTDVAINSADVILVKNNPLDIVVLLKLLKSTYHKMIHNLWWATGYNIIAIPLAAGILAPLGITLTPAIGAILMSLSTIIVSLNAMSLRLPK